MNERIKELSGRALDLAVPETWTTLDADQLARYSEKLVELAVMECLARADAITESLEKDGDSIGALGAAWAALAISREFGFL
jgi:hypothetical protein